MDRPAPRLIIALGALIAGLAAVASGAGVFLRGDLATAPFVTVRGEEVDVLGAGVYRFNGLAIAAEGVGWDFVTLVLVVPVFLVTLAFLARGSLRAQLAALGLLAYFLYQYAQYAMFLAYGPLFPVYVATFSLSLCTMALLVAQLDLVELAGRVSAAFPRRGAIALASVMAVLLAGMWLPLIGRTWDQAVVAELDGATTLVVQAFDLGLLVPLGLFAAVTVYRRLPVGYVLATIVAVKALAMGAAIVAMLAFEYAATDVLALPPMLIFAAIALFGGWLAVRILTSIRSGRTVEHTTPSATMAHASPAGPHAA
jgi:hypothetical protein